MKIIVKDEWDALTVKKILFDRLGLSRSAVTAMKKREGGICVNGECVTVRRQVRAGDEIRLLTEDTAPSPRIRESVGPIEILYEDEAILAVNKPPHMAVHPSKKLQDDTLAGRILHHRSPMVFRAAGRLDRDTSGVVLCAKSQVVSASFFHLIRKRQMYKEYLLLAEGESEPASSGVIDLCIRRSEDSYVTRVGFPADGTETEAERALTSYRILATSGRYRLILASPITGRTHQLRCHFASIGLPLVGDTLYGKPSDRIERQALHARALAFCHPVTGEPLCIEAPLPQDMACAIDSLFGTLTLPPPLSLREAAEAAYQIWENTL